MLIKFFGDNETAKKREILENYKDKFNFNNLFEFKEKLNYDSLILLKQIHSNVGHIVDKNNLNNYCENVFEGDYLITNLSGVAIGVYTADCLPIIVYDKKNKVISIVHAGWPGSVSKITLKAINDMQDNFKTNINDLEIYFGPSAKDCCYEVGQDFKDNLKDYNFIDKVLTEKNKKLYFNLPQFNILLLESIGIKKNQINIQFNLCTICGINFSSYRRDKNDVRQLSMAVLK